MAVVVFRGASGSGKSFLVSALERKNEYFDDPALAKNLNTGLLWVKQILSIREKTKDAEVHTFSADGYFTDDKGGYHFNPQYLGEAHATCLKGFTKALDDMENLQYRNSRKLLIVDNTNTSIAEVAPYIALANAFKHDLYVITIIHDPEDCFKRNSHGVPAKSILGQHTRLLQSLNEWPSFWPQDLFYT